MSAVELTLRTGLIRVWIVFDVFITYEGFITFVGSYYISGFNICLPTSLARGRHM